jgi:hypothetical protein
MGYVEKNRIADLQVRFGNSVKRSINVWPELLVSLPAPGLRKKAIREVIIVQVNSPEAPENFFRQGGFSRTGHSHDQNERRSRLQLFAHFRSDAQKRYDCTRNRGPFGNWVSEVPPSFVL